MAENDHQHTEAFRLMQYECNGCGTIEWIWNSRDGMAPLGVNCRTCGSEAMHVRWDEDQYAPDYTPPLGSRMFVDLTPRTAREYALANAKRFWDDPTYQTNRWESVEALADDLTKGYTTPGALDVVVVTG